MTGHTSVIYTAAFPKDDVSAVTAEMSKGTTVYTAGKQGPTAVRGRQPGGGRITACTADAGRGNTRHHPEERRVRTVSKSFLPGNSILYERIFTTLPESALPEVAFSYGNDSHF